MPRNPYYAGPVSPHFDGERFFNPGQPTTDRAWAALLRWRLLGQRARWPASVATRQVIPPQRSDALRITMVGHATLLIQADGSNILTDPVWSDRASPVAWAGPRRATAPGIALEHLPPIDTVLVTHNHYDHLDIATLRHLWRCHRPQIIAPLGNDAVISRRAPEIAVATHDWYETIRLAAGPLVTLHPAHHWSARGLGDRRMALWCGYIIATSQATIYLSGDTGYGDSEIFCDVARRHGAPDVAILPIGAYAPRWFMKGQHTDPEEAVEIMLDTGARQALGIHWGTFNLSDEPRLDPKTSLHVALAAKGLPANRFAALQSGEIWPAA